jgi:hypothetical protein
LVAGVLHNNYESNGLTSSLSFSAANLIPQETSCNTGKHAARTIKPVSQKKPVALNLYSRRQVLFRPAAAALNF